ncbi:MAG: hypothetical protein DRN53_01055 [Thermoprotei archaeon]|nr:MAG: hypothetical protein DRN53_01055 [Thermoprotei archaeon]
MSGQGLKYANVEIPANESVTAFGVKGLDINPEQISDNVETPPASGGKGVGFVFTKMIDSAEVKVFLSILELAGGSKGYTMRLDLLVRAVRERS